MPQPCQLHQSFIFGMPSMLAMRKPVYRLSLIEVLSTQLLSYCKPPFEISCPPL